MNRHRIIHGGISLVLAGALLLSGCARKDPDASITGQENQLPAYQSSLNMVDPQAYATVEGLALEPGTAISLIGKDSDSPFWDAVKAGAQQAVEDCNTALGYSGGDRITLSYVAPEEGGSIDEQVNILDEELARYPDAIALASMDLDAYATQFDQATENGIPIVTLDARNNYQGVLCLCKTDNVEAAATGAVNLCDEMEDAGSLLILAPTASDPNTQERIQGIQQEVASRPGISLAQALYLDQLEEGGLEAFLGEHPEITGILATDGTATALALETLQALDKGDIALVGFDLGESQLEALEQGEISGLVVQNPFGMGYAAVVACARSILEAGNQAVVDTGYIWVTKDNLETPSIADMLYL